MLANYFLENRNSNFFTFLGILFGKERDLSSKSGNFHVYLVCNSLAWPKYFKIDLNHPIERR